MDRADIVDEACATAPLPSSIAGLIRCNAKFVRADKNIGSALIAYESKLTDHVPPNQRLFAIVPTFPPRPSVSNDHS
jgi:hypothetical protein